MKFLLIVLSPMLVFAQYTLANLQPIPILPDLFRNSCSVNYDKVSSVLKLQLNMQQLGGPAGNPGPRGPPGASGKRGKKGDQAPAGEDSEDALSELQVMKFKLIKLRTRVDILEGKWLNASNGYWYKYLSSKMPWRSAKQGCEKIGAVLATIGARDVGILDFLAKELLSGYDAEAWIGLHDLEKEGDWVWLDGVVSTEANTRWEEGEPNNTGGDEDCGIANSKGNVNDLLCTESRYALCEMAP